MDRYGSEIGESIRERLRPHTGLPTNLWRTKRGMDGKFIPLFIANRQKKFDKPSRT